MLGQRSRLPIPERGGGHRRAGRGRPAGAPSLAARGHCCRWRGGVWVRPLAFERLDACGSAERAGRAGTASFRADGGPYASAEHARNGAAARFGRCHGAESRSQADAGSSQERKPGEQAGTHAPRGFYGRWARKHHLSHHFSNPNTNHGVTSPVWDLVFGTYADHGKMRVPRRHAPLWLLDETGRVRPEYADGYEVAGVAPVEASAA